MARWHGDEWVGGDRVGRKSRRAKRPARDLILARRPLQSWRSPSADQRGPGGSYWPVRGQRIGEPFQEGAHEDANSFLRRDRSKACPQNPLKPLIATGFAAKLKYTFVVVALTRRQVPVTTPIAGRFDSRSLAMEASPPSRTSLPSPHVPQQQAIR